MSWILSAAGDCPAAMEHDFAAELEELLQAYGATTSQLSGVNVNGPVHVPPPQEEKPGKAAKA